MEKSRRRGEKPMRIEREKCSCWGNSGLRLRCLKLYPEIVNNKNVLL